MLATVDLEPNNLLATAKQLISAWENNYVIHIRNINSIDPNQVKGIYEKLVTLAGTPYFLAEDSTLGDRSKQRSGELWTEVRYDPSIPNAYRHSREAQPLHTDGSYIPSYPNATLMCCISSAPEGGETVFIAAEDLVSVLSQEDPKLLGELWETVVPHARSGDFQALPVIRQHEEPSQFLLNWNYYCVDESATQEVSELREKLFQFLSDSPGVQAATKALALQAGEGVAWKDQKVLHGRNSFLANKTSDRFLCKAAVDIGVFK